MAWQGSHSRGFPTNTRARILQRDRICRCQGCRHHTGPCTQPSTDADHIINLARGGTNDESNGQGLCHPCHLVKTAHEAHAHRPKRTRAPEQHPGGYPPPPTSQGVGSSRVDLQACKLEYSIVSPK